MLAFAQPLAAQIADVDRRRADRADVALDTQMANREGHVFRARILNLSETGFMAHVDMPLCERAPVRIDVPTIGWVRADVVWELGDRVGAVFRTALNPHALRMFVRIFGERPRA